jgi:hypothetical protein
MILPIEPGEATDQTDPDPPVVAVEIAAGTEEEGLPWALDTIQERIDARLSELGKSRQSLPSIARKGWGENGPSLRMLCEIARILEWELPQLLGIRTAKPDDIDEQVLIQAMRIMAESIQRLKIQDWCPLTDPEKAGRLVRKLYGWVAIIADHEPDLAFSQQARRLAALELKFRREPFSFD